MLMYAVSSFGIVTAVRCLGHVYTPLELLVPASLHYLASNFACSQNTRKLNYRQLRRVVVGPTPNTISL